MQEITLKIGSVNANKLALACKICLMATLQWLPLVGIKWISPGDSAEATSANWKTMEASQWNMSLWWPEQEPCPNLHGHSGCHTQGGNHHSWGQCLWNVGMRNLSLVGGKGQAWIIYSGWWHTMLGTPPNPRGNPWTHSAERGTSQNHGNALTYGVPPFLPLEDINGVGCHLNGDLILLLTFHLGTNKLKMPGLEVLFSEKPWQPWDAVTVNTCSWSTLEKVLLGEVTRLLSIQYCSS